MKKIFVLGFVIAAFLSCSIEDNPQEEFHSEILPIVNATLPDEMHYRESYTITYT